MKRALLALSALAALCASASAQIHSSQTRQSTTGPVEDIAAIKAHPVFWSDFTGGSVYAPYIQALIASGTLSVPAASLNHPGVIGLKSAAGANSGVAEVLGAVFELFGQEMFDGVVKFPTITSVTTWLGMLDNSTAAEPTDAACFMIVDGTASGVTFSNNSSSITASTYLTSIDTWYSFRVYIDAGDSRANFGIYDESGSLLWSDSVTTNIPSGAARQTGAGIVTYSTIGSSRDLVYLDFLGFGYDYAQVR